jgi:hypothetical protein
MNVLELDEKIYHYWGNTPSSAHRTPVVVKRIYQTIDGINQTCDFRKLTGLLLNDRDRDTKRFFRFDRWKVFLENFMRSGYFGQFAKQGTKRLKKFQLICLGRRAHRGTLPTHFCSTTQQKQNSYHKTVCLKAF